MFSSIPKLSFKLMLYSLFIHKVNGDTVYDLRFLRFIFDFHHKVQMHSPTKNPTPIRYKINKIMLLNNK